MKKLFILFVFALIISACDKSSSSDSDTSFRIQPDTLTAFSSSATPFTTNLETGTYAIIYNGTINGTSYVGIACSDNPLYPENPTPEDFNIKIYFQSPSIPSSKTIASSVDGTIVVKKGSTIYDAIDSGSITLNIDSPVVTGSYTTYHITSTGSIVIEGYTLTSLDITALKASN